MSRTQVNCSKEVIMAIDNQLMRSTPEAQGISSASILRFVEEAEENIHALHSFMLLRHGWVVAEGWWSPYASQIPHILFSLTKSFTSTGVGLAVSEGRLSVDDPVTSFFKDDLPTQLSENLSAMRVRHLLSMSTGHVTDSMESLMQSKDGNWTKAFLQHPVEFVPGTHFLYDTGASYMLSAIVQKVTGLRLRDYLEPRLFEPLGIQPVSWDLSPQGKNIGGFGLSITTESIARFGQLYLNKGSWRGRQILPQAWIDEATSFQVPNAPNVSPDWEQGYGYQFWRSQHGAYRGDGACGQFCLVMPDQEVVLAITAGVDDMQGVLNRVWDILLPAMQPAPLPADGVSLKKLEKKLSSLRLPFPLGAHSSSVLPGVSGKLYTIQTNEAGIESIVFDFSKETNQFILKGANHEERIPFGYGSWCEGTTWLFDSRPKKVAASAAWSSEDTLILTLCLNETPFILTLTNHFEKNRLTVISSMNVSFGNLGIPPLEGNFT